MGCVVADRDAVERVPCLRLTALAEGPSAVSVTEWAGSPIIGVGGIVIEWWLGPVAVVAVVSTFMLFSISIEVATSSSDGCWRGLCVGDVVGASDTSTGATCCNAVARAADRSSSRRSGVQK